MWRVFILHNQIAKLAFTTKKFGFVLECTGEDFLPFSASEKCFVLWSASIKQESRCTNLLCERRTCPPLLFLRMALFESHFNSNCDYILTSSFCGLSKQIGTDTALNVNG